MTHKLTSILIVEDDPFIALDLQDFFLDEGYNVIGPTATSSGGLSLLDAQSPDCALLDYNLLSDTSDKIATRLDREKIPYIFLTGQINRVVSSVHPSIPIVSKPFDPFEIRTAINQILQTA